MYDVTHTISTEERNLLTDCYVEAARHRDERYFRIGRIYLITANPKSKLELFLGSEQDVWIYKREHIDKDLKFLDGRFYETGTTTKRVTYVVSSMPWNLLLPVKDGNGPDPVPKVNKPQNISCTWNAVTMQMEWGYFTAHVRKEPF
jgi:hypothetical protein